MNNLKFVNSAGHVIVITATPYGDPTGRFVISFTEGNTKREQLHFNPRFKGKVVVRNNMNENGSYVIRRKKQAQFIIQIRKSFTGL